MNKTIIHNIYSNRIKILLILFTSLLINSSAYSQQYTEYEVKTAYLYNFAKFVEWPESSFRSDELPFIIGIHGNDSFYDQLITTLKDKKIKNRKIIIKYFETTEDITNCHLLFITKITKFEAIKALKTLKNKAILTVGDDIDDFCKHGGIINFTKQFDRYRFEVNNYFALQESLLINPKLLALARIIKSDEAEF